jgi:uncharacterized protein YkwD
VVGGLTATWTRRAALVAALLVLVLPAAGRAAAVQPTANEAAMLVDLNHARIAHGLPALVGDVRLVRAARGHSAAMLAGGAFEHGPFSSRIRQQGVPAGRFGETIAWASRPAGAERLIVALWLGSPEHRRILLSPVFDRVGIGISIGRFQGKAHAFVVTADFLGPLK